MTKHWHTTHHPRRAAAATGAAFLALLGASTAPSHAFLATTSAYPTHPGRSTRQRAGSDLRTSMTPVAVALPEGQPASTARAVPAVPAAEVNLEGGGTSERRWINDVKSGDKVIGYVTDTASFAAFVDVGVVRKGSQVGLFIRRCGIFTDCIAHFLKKISCFIMKNMFLLNCYYTLHMLC